MKLPHALIISSVALVVFGSPVVTGAQSAASERTRTVVAGRPLDIACERRRNEWDRRVLLIITDGYDNASVATVDQIRRQAERTNTVIDAIGLFDEHDSGHVRAGRHELTTLADRTGGIAYFPATVEEIESVAVAVARQIRNQYTIGYTALDQRVDGSYRAIRVVIDRGRLTVHTKAGYRAVREAP